MKITLLFITIASITVLASCEVQSGITKKSVEKYVDTPTPMPDAAATPEEPIDPADIVKVDTSVQGPSLSINDPKERKALNCNRYNRVSINVNGQKVTIKGACMQLMINGDQNEITAEALMEVVLNGHENTVRYSKFPNGHRPVITDNGQGNLMEKASPAETK